MDAVIRLAGPPQVIALAKYLFRVGLGQEVIVKSAEVIRKIISWRQYGNHCYNVGDEFIFEREGDRDDFWHMGLNTLVKTNADPDTVAGGPKMPHCSEAWDAIARYIYTGLQGGSILTARNKI